MRVYGHDPGEGPQPGREYVELCGGPLDGQFLDVTDMTPAEQAEGALLITPRGAYGPGGRSDYGLGNHPGRWDWRGDVP